MTVIYLVRKQQAAGNVAVMHFYSKPQQRERDILNEPGRKEQLVFPPQLIYSSSVRQRLPTLRRRSRRRRRRREDGRAL